MGVFVGLGAIILELWVGSVGWAWRILALLLIGGILCGIQYMLLRLRRQRNKE